MLEDEAALIKDAQGGSAAAFEALWAHYKARIRAILWEFGLGDAGDDCLQEIAFKVWRALRGFRGQSKFYSFVFTIARRHCIDWRRHRRLTARGVEWLGYAQAILPEEWLIQAERQQLLRTALDEVLMPARYRDSMWLTLDGYSETEAAQSMQLTVPQFRGNRHRALAILEATFRNELQTRLLAAVRCDNLGFAKHAEEVLQTIVGNPQADAVTEASAQICLARCLDHQRRPDDALEVLLQLLERPGFERRFKDQFWWARHQVGIMRIQLGQYADADEILKEVCRESGEHVLSATHQRGVIALKQRRFAAAEALFLESLAKRSPRSYRRAFDVRGLALLNLRIGHTDLAWQQITEAHTTAKTHGIQWYVRKIGRDLRLFPGRPR